MTAAFDTPIVLILYNRPDRLREVIDVVREIRPSQVLVVADGPRAAVAGDDDACILARAELERIDWPCTIDNEFASTNLGCDRRVVSGLDWAFSLVERAIVLEDDVLPHPSFFPWARSMLDRFGEQSEVTIISGHNRLGRWGDGGADHLRARRFSVWGWAGTAAWWRNTNDCPLDGDPARALDDVARPGLDPLQVKIQALLLRAYRDGDLKSWDLIYGLRTYLLDKAALVSTVNLTANTGIGPGATHTYFEDDFSGLIPVGTAAAAVESGPTAFDEAYDRAVLLTELMTRCADPPKARRLAARLGRIPIDESIQLHLAPFAVPGESLALLEDLAQQGVQSPHFDVLLQTLRQAALTEASAQ